MVAINYAKDVRVGEQPTKAVALGSNFVWPPLPERLFFRGQSLVYDFVRQRYGVRRPGNFTLVAGETPIGSGYISEALAARQGAPDLATGSISAQPLPGIEIEGVLFGATSSASQLTIYFLGDVVSSLDGIRVWVGAVELAGTPDIVDYYPQENVTTVAYNNPDMDPWVDGGKYNLGITLGGQELPDDPFDYTTNVNDLGIVTRASTATYWGPEGTLLEAAVDEARIQHDPVTGEAMGLLVESSRTSAFPYSCDPGTWNYIRGVVLEQGHPSPIPGYTSTRVSYSGEGTSTYAGSSQWRTQELNSAAVIYRPINGSSVVVGHMSSIVSGPTKAVVRSDGSVSYRGTRIAYLSVKPLSDGFLEIRFTLDMSHYSSGWVIGIGLEGETDSFDLAYFQNEYEVTPPSISYLITDGTNVTRAADDAVIDLSDVLNPVEGTYVVRAAVKDDGEAEYYAGWYGGGEGTDRMSIRRLASGRFEFKTTTTSTATIAPPEHLKAGDVVALAIAYSEGQMTAAAFGETRTRSSGYTPGAGVRLVRGTGNNVSDNALTLESSGIIAGFEYYPRALTEAELAGITAFNPEAQP